MATSKSLPYKRKNYYIDKDFQTKFIARFCFIVIVGSVLTLALVYYLARLSTTVAIVHSRVTVMSTSDFILPLLIQTVIVVTVVVSLMAMVMLLFASHKMAGPIYRFKQTFKDLTKGDFSRDVRLRAGDQWQDLAAEINQFISVMRSRSKVNQDQWALLKSNIERLNALAINDQQRQELELIKKTIQRLDETINFIKT
jgi:signal transduction histidine kinase